MKKRSKLTKEQKAQLALINLPRYREMRKREILSSSNFCPWLDWSSCHHNCWILFPQTENRYFTWKKKEEESNPFSINVKNPCACNFLSPTYVQRKFRHLLSLYLKEVNLPPLDESVK